MRIILLCERTLCACLEFVVETLIGISLVQYRTEMFPIFLGIIPLGFLCISKKLKNKFGRKLFEYNYS